MRRLSTCNTYIQIEEGPGSVKAFYSYGIHKTVEITGTVEEICHVEVLEQNGETFRWSTKRMYLVGHKMYGISLTPMGYRLFAQQDNRPGGMICYDLRTGEELWRLPTRAEISCLFVGEETLCCAKSRTSIVLYDMGTGKQLAERKTPYDNRFTVLTEGAIFNHTCARTWEVLDPRTLAVLEEVRDADLMKDTGTIYRRLFARYARKAGD